MQPTAAPNSRPAPAGPAQPGDLWGGLAAVLVALPAAMAYGIAVFGAAGPDYVGYGARAGLLGAAVLGLIASLVGGAPSLISAPCAPAAAVLAALGAELLTGAAGGTAERLVALLALVAALAGLLQMALGALGVGRLIKFIPYPVVSGYLSGVAVLIFAGQIPRVLGLPPGAEGWEAWCRPADWSRAGLFTGGAAILGVLCGSRLTRRVPAPLIGLAAGLAAYWAIAAGEPALRSLADNRLVVGRAGTGDLGPGAALAAHFRALAGLRPADVSVVWIPALTLAVLLAIDTLKTGVVLDALTRRRHDANRVLIGQGAGNLGAALAGGMPGAGTLGATLVNVESGGRTRLSGVVAGALALAAGLAPGGWLAWIPVPALAGILMVVAARMVSWRDFALLRQRATRLDFAVIAAVVIVAVTVNLMAAAGAGVALATLLFIRDQIRAPVIRRKISGARLSSRQHRLPEEQAVLERRGDETTICELQGTLFFGTTDQLFTELEADLQRCRYLVLDLRRVRSFDFTAAHLLEQFEGRLAERDGFLVFSRLPHRLAAGLDLARYFEETGMTRGRRRVRVFESLDDALQWVEDRLLAEARPAGPAVEAPLALGECPLLQGRGDDALRTMLAAVAVPRTVPAGAAVFRAGEPGDELYLIRRGIVRIVLPLADGGHHTLASFGRGGFFGEIAFLDAGRRSADAVALADTDLWVISRARFEEAARTAPGVAARLCEQLARVLALRLRRADAEITALYEA